MNRHYFPVSFSRLLQFCLGLGMAMLLSACGGGGGTVGLPTGTTLYTNAPGALTLAAGASADYSIGGGTPTYTAATSNRDVVTASASGTSLHIVAVAGGSATVSITDQAGASSSVTVTVTAAPVTPAPQPGVLFTTAAGTLTVATGSNASYGIGGGKAPYAVSSSNASVASASINGSNFTVNGLAPGAAQIVVTDAAGVSLSVAVTVGSGTPTPLYTTSPSGVTVAVGASASYAVGGGKPGYAISSSNNAVAKVGANGGDFIITGVSPGSAQVAVVDTAGAALSIDVTVGAGGTATALFVTAPSSVTIQPGVTANYTIGGGKPAYAVSSSNTAVAQVGISGNGFIVTGGQSGSAQIAVSDTSGTMVTFSVTVGSAGPGPTLFSTAPSTVSLAVGATESYSVNGGTAPYAVSSSNSAVATVMITGKTFVITGASAGSAQISVFDATGSSVSTTVTVGTTTANPPLFTTAPPEITMALGEDETFTLGGGKPPYAATSSNGTVAKVAITGNSYTITALTAGSAKILLSDASGQTPISLAITVGTGTGTTPFYTTAPSNLTLTAGSADSFVVAGGKGPYAVSTGNASVAKIVLTGNDFVITGVSGGATQVAVFDSTGASVGITVTVPAGAVFSTTAPPAVTVAAGLGTSYAVSGGKGPYTASSSNTAVATVAMTGSDFTITGMSAGTAQVTVFDSTGAAIGITVTVPAPAALTSNAPGTLTLAAGSSSATYAISGGKAPFTGSTGNSSVATIVVAGSVFTINGTGPGTAQVAVFDSAGASVAVVVTVPAGAAFTTTAPPSITLAAGTGATFTASGGKSPYSGSTDNPAVAKIVFTGSDFTINGIGPGTASVLVFDSAGAKETITVTVPPGPAGTPLFSNAPSAVTLAAGSPTSFSVSGGSGAYSATSSTPSVATASMAGGTLTITPLALGTAKINVSDSAGASLQIDVTVTQAGPSVIVLLPGAATGNVGDTLTFIVRGGTPSYTITINNTSIATVSPAVVAGSGGTFAVNLRNVGSTTATITDALGQTTSLPITAEQTSTTLRLSPNELLVGENDASPIVLDIYGGTGPYRAFTSDQTLTSVSTVGAKLTIAVGSNGSRCIPSITADGTYTPFGTFDVTITTLDSLGASATSVLTIKDNGKGLNIGCP